jgi:hypothetical protein
MSFLQPIIDNPIFVRELRRRMRGKAMIFSTNAYIIFMCLVTAGVLVFYELYNRTQTTSSIDELGLILFQAIFIVQAVVVVFVAPTITSGMATAERERKTFDFLRVTTLSPFTFVLGALFSTMLYAGVVLVCALPLLCVSFLYGGVSPLDIIQVFFLLAGFSFLLGSAGLMISSTRDKTKRAQGVTVVLVIIVGIFFLQKLQISTPHHLVKQLSQTTLIMGQFAVPNLLLFVGVILGVSGVFLMIAARKLYESENRPLAYRHFLILGALGSGLFFIATAGNIKENWFGYWWLASIGFLFFAAISLCLHTVQVGTENWELKKRVPFLRSFDESVPFVAIMGGVWAYLTLNWLQNAQSGFISPLIPASYRQNFFATLPFALIAMALLVFCVALSARFWAHYSADRMTAFKRVISFWVVVAIVIPLVLQVIFYSAQQSNHMPLVRALIYLSPYHLMHALTELPRGALSGAASASEMAESLQFSIGFLLVTCVAFGALALYYSKKNSVPVSYERPLAVSS